MSDEIKESNLSENFKMAVRIIDVLQELASCKYITMKEYCKIVGIIMEIGTRKNTIKD